MVHKKKLLFDERWYIIKASKLMSPISKERLH